MSLNSNPHKHKELVCTQNVCWPEITFGPINLLTLPDAYWFYMSTKEKMEEFHRINGCDRVRH